jgi:hypothetical protein
MKRFVKIGYNFSNRVTKTQKKPHQLYLNLSGIENFKIILKLVSVLNVWYVLRMLRDTESIHIWATKILCDENDLRDVDPFKWLYRIENEWKFEWKFIVILCR